MFKGRGLRGKTIWACCRVSVGWGCGRERPNGVNIIYVCDLC